MSPVRAQQEEQEHVKEGGIGLQPHSQGVGPDPGPEQSKDKIQILRDPASWRCRDDANAIAPQQELPVVLFCCSCCPSSFQQLHTVGHLGSTKPAVRKEAELENTNALFWRSPGKDSLNPHSGAWEGPSK
uniref:Uncharacterized protein n=1 Tax=Sus scrofa TaxID=9823 RepID=A0A480F2W2_PIG